MSSSVGSKLIWPCNRITILSQINEWAYKTSIYLSLALRNETDKIIRSNQSLKWKKSAIARVTTDETITYVWQRCWRFIYSVPKCCHWLTKKTLDFHHKKIPDHVIIQGPTHKILCKYIALSEIMLWIVMCAVVNSVFIMC